MPIVLYRCRVRETSSRAEAEWVIDQPHLVAQREKIRMWPFDCVMPVEDKITAITSSETFLLESTNKAGVAETLGDSVTITQDKNKININSNSYFSKRNLKYLAKKNFKKHNIRDWLWVIASNKEMNVYELRYFNIAKNNGRGRRLRFKSYILVPPFEVGSVVAALFI